MMFEETDNNNTATNKRRSMKIFLLANLILFDKYETKLD